MAKQGGAAPRRSMSPMQAALSAVKLERTKLAESEVQIRLAMQQYSQSRKDLDNAMEDLYDVLTAEAARISEKEQSLEEEYQRKTQKLNEKLASLGGSGLVMGGGAAAESGGDSDASASPGFGEPVSDLLVNVGGTVFSLERATLALLPAESRLAALLSSPGSAVDSPSASTVSLSSMASPAPATVVLKGKDHDPRLFAEAVALLRSPGQTSEPTADQIKAAKEYGLLSLLESRIVHINVVGGYRPSSEECLSELLQLESSGSWVALPSLAVARRWVSAVVNSGYLYVVGGGREDGDACNSVDRFNLRSRAWESEDIPDLNTPRAGSECVALGDCLYVIGGFDGSKQLKTMESFQINQDGSSWVFGPSMGSERCYFACAVAPETKQIFVAGGYAGGTQPLETLERFDVATGQWTQLPPLRSARLHCSGAFLGGSFYVCGGRQGPQILKTVERFNTKTNLWEGVAPMHQARSSFGCVVVDGFLFVLAGWNGHTALSSVEKYDPDTNTWTQEQSLPYGLCNVGCSA